MANSYESIPVGKELERRDPSKSAGAEDAAFHSTEATIALAARPAGVVTPQRQCTEQIFRNNKFRRETPLHPSANRIILLRTIRNRAIRASKRFDSVRPVWPNITPTASKFTSPPWPLSNAFRACWSIHVENQSYRDSPSGIRQNHSW